MRNRSCIDEVLSEVPSYVLLLDDILFSISSQISEHLGRENISHEKLSKMSGLNLKTVKSVISGDVSINLNSLCKIVESLNLDIDIKIKRK